MKDGEVWRAVVGYQGLYEVSDHGGVRSKSRQGSAGGILSISPDKRGYMKVSLYNKGRKARWVHTLVLEAFVGPRPPGQMGCHKNGNPSQNYLSNLRWDTRESNYDDSRLHGTAAIGAQNAQTKLTPQALVAIRAERAHGRLQREIAAKFGISQQHVSQILSGDCR